MEYNKNYLPDFYSVRNNEQIDYSFEGMEDKKCLIFWDNGFTSNIIEPNNRNMKFIWDGFLLFIDKDISIDDISKGINLFDQRLVALQRLSLKHEKSNSEDKKEYILDKLKSMGIPYEVMMDKKEVDGYPSECDLWSTRDESVLIDAMDASGDGKAFFFKDALFDYTITFDKTPIPSMHYEHKGAVVLRGENEVAISRLIENDKDLRSYLEGIVGSEKLHSLVEKRDLSGTNISNLERNIK